MGHICYGTDIFAMGHICYGTYLLWDIFAMGHICYGTHLLCDTFVMGHICYGAYLLWDIFAMGHICYGTHLLWDTFVMGHICYGTYLLCDIFAMGHICYGTYLLWDTFVMGHISLLCPRCHFHGIVYKYVSNKHTCVNNSIINQSHDWVSMGTSDCYSNIFQMATWVRSPLTLPYVEPHCTNKALFQNWNISCFATASLNFVYVDNTTRGPTSI